MRLLYGLLVIILSSPSIHSQLYHATYEAKLNTTDGEFRSGTTSLFFNADTAKFIYHDIPKVDNTDIDGQIITSVTGDKDGLPIVTYRSTFTQVYKEPYFSRRQMSILKEDIPKIDWKISGESIKTNGVTVLRASGNYGNRSYEVLFSPDLPFPYGPHRFFGLPGLITSIKSTDGYVSFVLTDFKPVPANLRPENLFEVGDGIKRTQKEFEEFVIKGLLLDESTSTSEWTTTSDSPSENFTIEKGKWHIIADYKKERGY